MVMLCIRFTHLSSGDTVHGLKWAYSTLRAHQAPSETISHIKMVYAMECVNNLLQNLGLDPELRAQKAKRAKV